MVMSQRIRKTAVYLVEGADCLAMVAEADAGAERNFPREDTDSLEDLALDRKATDLARS